MKKLLLFLLFSFGTGFCLDSFGQTNNNPVNNPTSVRIVYFFIDDLETSNDVQSLNDYLALFHEKIVSIETDLTTQMCTLKIKKFTDEDIEQIISQAGFKSYKCEALPPTGFKYVFNPDRTWKTKELTR